VNKYKLKNRSSSIDIQTHARPACHTRKLCFLDILTSQSMHSRACHGLYLYRLWCW